VVVGGKVVVVVDVVVELVVVVLVFAVATMGATEDVGASLAATCDPQPANRAAVSTAHARRIAG